MFCILYLFYYRFYDVIVKELGSNANFPQRKPNSYTNNEIMNEIDGLYVAGRIYDLAKLDEVFLIGDELTPSYKANILSLGGMKRYQHT